MTDSAQNHAKLTKVDEHQRLRVIEKHAKKHGLSVEEFEEVQMHITGDFAQDPRLGGLNITLKTGRNVRMTALRAPDDRSASGKSIIYSIKVEGGLPIEGALPRA